jgi:hypothetical protein
MKNPVEGFETSTKTAYKAIKIAPAQTLSILRSLTENVWVFVKHFLNFMFAQKFAQPVQHP